MKATCGNMAAKWRNNAAEKGRKARQSSIKRRNMKKNGRISVTSARARGGALLRLPRRAHSKRHEKPLKHCRAVMCVNVRHRATALAASLAKSRWRGIVFKRAASFAPLPFLRGLAKMAAKHGKEVTTRKPASSNKGISGVNILSGGGVTKAWRQK